MLTLGRTAPYIMPNGKRLRTTGRFDTPEQLYQEVRRDYHESPASRNVATIARWAKVSETTVHNILNAEISATKPMSN